MSEDKKKNTPRKEEFWIKIKQEAREQRKKKFLEIQNKINNGTAQDYEITLLKQEAKMFEEVY